MAEKQETESDMNSLEQAEGAAKWGSGSGKMGVVSVFVWCHSVANGNIIGVSVAIATCRSGYPL